MPSSLNAVDRAKIQHYFVIHKFAHKKARNFSLFLASLFYVYAPTHDVAPSAVTIAVAIDAIICTMNLMVSLLLIVVCFLIVLPTDYTDFTDYCPGVQTPLGSPYSGGKLSPEGSPPEFLDEPSGKAEREGIGVV